jgi:uncharacterized cupin superfamily protein
VERDVTFAEAADDVHADIDAAYHAKYDQYGPKIVGTVVGPEAAAVTIKLEQPSANRVFFSPIDTDNWEHDDETGGLVHMLRSDDAVQAGLWKPTLVPGQREYVVTVDLVWHETILVLEGAGQIEIEGGPTLELRPGNMISLPKGARTRWVVSDDFKEFWVYS